MSKRLEYQRQFAQGRIVNIGCGECPIDFGPDSVNVDLDVYNHHNFVQADAHHLPFADGEFDTAILGDMLEHCPDPVQVLREAGRVATTVVATVFEEWRCPSHDVSENIPVMQQKCVDDLRDMGFSTHLEYLKSLPTVQGKIVAVTSDSEVSHHPHIQQFTDDDILRMVPEAGLEFIIYRKFPEGEHEGHVWYNWLIVARRKTL